MFLNIIDSAIIHSVLEFVNSIIQSTCVVLESNSISPNYIGSEFNSTPLHQTNVYHFVNSQDEQNSERRRLGPNESSRSRVFSTSTSPSPLDSNVFLANDEDEARGDLSCINGTFLPAPFVQHAVIKYVK